MSSFTTLLVTSPLKNGRDWELQKSFSYHVGTRYSRDIIKVPKGFITDFASTDILQWVAVILSILYAGFLWLLPQWVGYIYVIIILLAILITPYGKQSKAAVLHDYLYQTHQVSRAMADLIFKEAMIVAGTPYWKAYLMHRGVRIGGWLSWH